jgi:histidinol dehydrogenase
MSDDAAGASSPDRPLREWGAWSEMATDARRSLVDRGIATIYDDALRDGIVAIIEDVRARGDAAVLDALRRFDGCELAAGGLRVSSDELDAGLAATSHDVVDALADAIAHLRRFNEKICERGDWSFESDPGLVVGERVTPIESAGLFIPSGKGSFPSVLVQLAVPAQVAGVASLVVAVPPLPGAGGTVDPAVLAACRLLGLDDVFRVNGPAGIAALAFGTESIPKVRLVVGPGSPAVTCAQVEVQRFGTVTVMVLGPTESLVIADDTTDVRLLAFDLLNEAEHGSDSTSLLVTTSASLVASVQREVAVLLATLPEPRRTYAADALGVNGGVIVVGDLDEAASVSNAFGPEHLQLALAHPDAVLARIRHAGEILIGQHTPFSSANYVLGCPASLPTSGFAKVSSGVTADTFRKRTAIARMDAEAMRQVTPSIVALARHEGFPAHEAAARARAE